MTRSLRYLTLALPLALAACGGESFHSIAGSALTDAKPGAQCAFDTVDNVAAGDSTTVKRGKPAQLSGWITDNLQRAPGTFSFVLGGAKPLALDAKTGVDRGDVALALKSDAAKTAGFTFVTDFSNVPAGTYPLQGLVTTDQGRFLCAFQRSLVVVD